MPGVIFGCSCDPMRGGALAEAVGFGFERPVLDDGDARPHRVAHPALALLHHMGQFVAEQLLARRGVRLKPARREIDVRTEGEGDRPDPLRLRPDMHPHRGEIGAERRFHPAAHRIRQGPAAAIGQTELGRIDRERTARPMRLHHRWTPGKGRRRRPRKARRHYRRAFGKDRRRWFRPARPPADEKPLDHPRGHDLTSS